MTPAFDASVFRGSRILQGILKGLARLRATELFSSEQVFTLGRWLLLFLLFSCIFVPRFSMASVGPFYRIDLRIEDLLLALLTLLTLGIMARKSSLPESPAVERVFLWFLLIAQVSILGGFFLQTIDKPLLSLFYLLKWVEYFLVFVITSRFAAARSGSAFFLKTFFALGLAVSCFGYWEHFFPAAKATYPNYYRLFERPPFHGDANHIGGMLVVWIGFFAGIFLRTDRRPLQAMLLGAVLFAFFPLIWTYSRKSYFALMAAFVLPFFVRGVRRKLLLLVCLFILFGLAFPTRLPERLIDLGEAFSSTDPFHSSWAGNWVMWKQALWNFGQFFLFGSGLGSRHRLFYESQYILILAETGVVGFALFGLLLLAPLREHLRLRAAGWEEKGIVLGWLMAFAGLLVHNFSCVSLTVSKIAIPFWFLTAATLTYFKQISSR